MSRFYQGMLDISIYNSTGKHFSSLLTRKYSVSYWVFHKKMSVSNFANYPSLPWVRGPSTVFDWQQRCSISRWIQVSTYISIWLGQGDFENLILTILFEFPSFPFFVAPITLAVSVIKDVHRWDVVFNEKLICPSMLSRGDSYRNYRYSYLSRFCEWLTDKQVSTMYKRGNAALQGLLDFIRFNF